jgi:hypothetical protein
MVLTAACHPVIHPSLVSYLIWFLVFIRALYDQRVVLVAPGLELDDVVGQLDPGKWVVRRIGAQGNRAGPFGSDRPGLLGKLSAVLSRGFSRGIPRSQQCRRP